MKKKEEQQENRFTYSNEDGLKVLSEQDIIDSIIKDINNKESGKKEDIVKSIDNQIKGGKADNLTIQDIADKHSISIQKIKEQIQIGLKIEMEHTDNPKIALEITLDHLSESPIYYTELEKMESKIKTE